MSSGPSSTVLWVHEPLMDHYPKHSQEHGEKGNETRRWLHLPLDSYNVALSLNFAAFLLPPLYSTLSQLWLVEIDETRVMPLPVYSWALLPVYVLNQTLPRAAWVIIGDVASRPIAQRFQVAHTLVLVQCLLGTVTSVVLCGLAPTLSSSYRFAPDIHPTTVSFLQIEAFSIGLASMAETALTTASRALHKPDVPLVVSLFKVLVRIGLDGALLSRAHIRFAHPSPALNASIGLAADIVATIAGLGYFLWFHTRPAAASSQAEFLATGDPSDIPTLLPKDSTLMLLLRPGVYTFTESAARHAFSAWLHDGANRRLPLTASQLAAWDTFASSRNVQHSLLTAHVRAAEATALAFVSRKWHEWRSELDRRAYRARAYWRTVAAIASAGLRSAAIVLAIEVLLAIVMLAFAGQEYTVFVLTGGNRTAGGRVRVAGLVLDLWRKVDWAFVLGAVGVQLGAVLLATRPRWWMYAGLTLTLGYLLPWAVVIESGRVIHAVDVKANDTTWKIWRWLFAGVEIAGFLAVLSVGVLWAWVLIKGHAVLERVVY